MIRIAIDGPAGAGKSTIAKRIALELGLDYVDTGAMYRAIALKLIRTGTDYNDAEALASMLASTDVDLDGGRVLLDGEPVEAFIRTPEVSAMASSSSTVLAIREKLVALQKAIARRKSVVMDGRDIGTNVIPDAEYKIFLTASPLVRARRRALEMEAKGMDADLDKILAEINERDYRDSHREHNPLKKADDAIEVDTSDLTIDQVVARIKGMLRIASC